MNKVILHPDERFIELQYIGKQTSETIQTMFEDAEKRLSELNRQWRPFKVLVDMSAMTKSTPGSRAASTAGIRHYKPGRIAVFGAPALFRQIVSLMIKAVGFRKPIKFFDRRHEAVAWLINSKETRYTLPKNIRLPNEFHRDQ